MANKYSFRQFLTQKVELVSNNEEVITIKIDKIVIPMIQRDYAQGRKNFDTQSNSEKLNPAGQMFIEEIFSTLTSDNSSNRLELDFIYGSVASEKEKRDGTEIDVEYFYPLDGQQRLTTLYLLYWFVGGIELSNEERNQLSKILKNFYYSTRTSSTDFCQELVSELNKDSIIFGKTERNENGELNSETESITKQIKNLSWFHDSYNLDPTIVSMLNMLDQIQKMYMEKECKNLFEKLDHLQFYVLLLNNFGLTEDLYVKMNARGKQLTSLENFKADLQHWLKENSKKLCLEKQNYYGRSMPYDMFIVNKIDNEWSKCFWNIKKHSEAKEFDSLFISFIYKFMLNEYILNSTSSNKKIDKEEDFKLFENEPEYSSFSLFDRHINKATLDHLSRVLDEITNHYDDILKGIQPCWLDEENAFNILTANLGLKERTVFCGVILYLIKKEFNTESFSNWIHVVWNIAENANIDSWRVAVGVIQLILELVDKADDIYEALSDEDYVINSNQSKETIAEERQKAKLRKSNTNWTNEFYKAESHPFFRGSISFLIPDNYSLDGFKHNYEMSKAFFDEKGVYEKYREENHLFLRALLSRYASLSDIKYHITDVAEKENSLKNMLSSDRVVRTAIREWFALPDEESIHQKLIEEAKKESPIPVTTNDFEKKLHLALYKRTDLINWMQDNGAIRYKDDYISRPNSMYDWLFVNGYGNEIIHALIEKGWECSNQCYIGEEKKPIPYYWTAAGREIPVNKVVKTANGEVLAKCLVGKTIVSLRIGDEEIENYSYLESVTDSSKVGQFVVNLDTRVNNYFN